MILKGRKIVGGYVEGEIIVSKDPVSFYGGIDPHTGMIIEPGHSLYGKKISGKVFVFPTGKGSTVGSYVIYQMKKLVFICLFVIIGYSCKKKDIIPQEEEKAALMIDSIKTQKNIQNPVIGPPMDPIPIPPANPEPRQ